MNEHKFQLGSRLKDKVSGMKGIATSRLEYLNGCIQYGIQPPYSEREKKKPDAHWIDEEQLEYVDKGITVQKKPKGGPDSIAHDYNG
jgi:hypothetical protein